MSEPKLPTPVVGMPVDQNGMTPDLVQVFQRMNDAIRDLRARVAALENP